MITHLIDWMIKCINKLISYQMIREITEDREENPALFLGYLTETL